MHYAKLHGCQNAYVYMPAAEVTGDPAALAREVSAPPPRGIGSDGLILYGPSSRADARMVVYNADGSRAAMCGNGIRALAKWLLDSDPAVGRPCGGPAPHAALAERLGPLAGAYERVLAAQAVPGDAELAVREISIESDSGVRTIEAVLREGCVVAAAVDAGVATLALGELAEVRPQSPQPRLVDEPIRAAGSTYRITCVVVGNLHAVIFVPDAAAVALDVAGPAIECHALFPDRVNVHFVTVASPQRLIMRPWERGSGATPACGTGACAALAAAVALGRAECAAQVEQPGGTLGVHLAAEGEGQWRAHLIGPAELVETGHWPRA